MIEVGRNNIIVRNVKEDSHEYKKAIYDFSLYDSVLHKYTFSVFSKNNNDLYFPASLTLERVQSAFPKEEVSVSFSNTAKAKTMNYIMVHQPKNELQREAIQFLLKMRKDPNTHQRFLSLETGSGKTYVSINVISQLKKRAMIIVDTIDLAEQWKREFLNHTNLQDADIVILSGQDSVDEQYQCQTGKIYIAIHRTLGNMLNNDINSVNSLMNKLGIGIRVFDESHVNFGNICKINSFSNVEYTIYLTATPNRTNFLDNSLYAKVFSSVPYFNGKNIESEKYHTVILCNMDTHPGIDDKIYVKTKYGFSQSRWADYVLEKGYEFLLESLSNIFKTFTLVERGKKTAIMLPTIKLINKVKTDLQIMYPNLDIGVFTGAVPKGKREEQLNKKVFITDEKIFGKGADVKDLEVLINYVPIGNIINTEQIIGRLRNREGYSSILIDVTDIGFDPCIKQSKIRKRYYKKKAKKIIEFIEKKGNK